MKKKTVTLSKDSFIFLLNYATSEADSAESSMDYYKNDAQMDVDTKEKRYNKEKEKFDMFNKIKDELLGFID